jgi:hypothetical protein
MKRHSIIASLFFSSVLIFLFSCKKEEGGMALNLTAPVEITSFTVDTAKGTIDTSNATILIHLPFATDFTKVVPEITVPQGAIVTPASGAPVNLSNPLQYQVINGNIYKNYTVTAKENPAILLFKAQGDTGVIDEATRTIKVIVPPGTDMTKVSVEVKLVAGASITPASGSVVDFTNPVVFKVTTALGTVNYTVTAIDENADKAVAFLGNYNSKNDITNADELAAFNWLTSTYPKAEFVSLAALKAGTVNLAKYGMLWWHEDATQTLPDIAFDNAVITAINTYRAGGGNLLLTTFGSRWIEPLGIVPPFKGPNNVFGDPYGNQWQDNNNNWGISINKDHANHPLFSGLPLASDKPYPVVYLLDKVSYRLNHTSWWKVNEWGGYGDAAGWRNQTGGIDLAGPDGSDNTNSNITIAEFPKTSANGATIVITPGSYDWYAEPNPSNSTPSPTNSYLPAIQKLTHNAIEYLKKQ